MKTLFTLLTVALLLGINLPSSFAVSADTELYFKKITETDSELSVEIRVLNPSTQMVKAVQSWVKYNPKVLKGKRIEADTSPFDFVAPGESTFDSAQGIAKIGRSTLQTGITDSDIYVATIVFEKLSNARTTLEFYNFQLGTESNTSVRVFEDGFPVNVLQEKPKSLTIGTASAGTATINNNAQNTNTSSSNILSNTAENSSANMFQETLFAIQTMQVNNLKVTTGPGYAILAWDKLDSEAVGYNVYYSNNSGRYLQRRSAGDVNEYYFDGLPTGEYFYFAVTAYDKNNKESDYSQEVRIKIGYPDSSTAPLAFSKRDAVSLQSTEHVQSGPKEILLLSSLIAGILTFFFVKVRKIC